MKALAGLLAAVAAPAGANPAAIGEALALCIKVVEAESPAPLKEAGLELVDPNTLTPPQWGVTYAAPAGIGEIRAGMDEYGGQAQGQAFHCYLHLPAETGSEAMRWEKLGLAPVMALTDDGFTQYGGGPVSPRLANCRWIGKPIYVKFHHSERVKGVRFEASDLAPLDSDPCKE